MDSALSTLYREHVDARSAAAARALSATGFDRLLVHSGKPFTYFADDNDAPFRSTPHFAHWTPLEGPGHLLDVVPGRRPRVFRLVPRDFWYEPPRPAPSFVTDLFDVTDVATPEEAWKAAAASHGGRTAFLGEAAEEAEANGIPRDAVNPPRLVARLDWDRACKTPYEVACLLEANAVASRGFAAAQTTFLAGGTELEAHHAFLAATGVMEEALPYPTIIGFDERSATLHYHGKRGHEAAPGRGMLVDAGVSVRGYGCDITRTFTSPRTDPTFRALVVGMDALQRRLADELRPERPYLEVHLVAHRLIGELLRETGILKVGVDEALASGLTRPFFPHGLGHFLGIQVHDVGGRQERPDGGTKAPPAEHPFLRTTRTLEEGMVITNEPGLYFIPMLLEPVREGAGRDAIDWRLVDRLTPFGGIRIEDDVVVGREGNQNLTRPHVP